MELLMDPNVWIAFAILTALEIVLGFDNIVFITVLVSKLPADIRDKVRQFGNAHGSKEGPGKVGSERVSPADKRRHEQPGAH